MAVSRHILITGASRGIGLGLTQAFVQAGWQVHAVIRNLAGSHELQALATQHGQRLQLIECDLEQREAGQLIDRALGDQPLTCALFNAGVYGPRTRTRARPIVRRSASYSSPMRSRRSAWRNSWLGASKPAA